MPQIPKSKLVENLYTNGTGEGNNIALRFIQSQIPYVGFYNIVSGKFYTGKVYTTSSKALEKYNIVQTSPSTIAYAGSVATKANSLTTEPGNQTRYFYKNLNSLSISITEINKNAYNQLAGFISMNYQVISFNPSLQDLDEVNKQMPGLREFLLS